jgi:hypothetical protein
VPEVTRTDPEGVDFGWVMQTTFVLTIVVGAPLVGLLAGGQSLPTWGARATFAVRVGAVVWLLTAAAVFLYARQVRSPRRSTERDSDADGDRQPPADSPEE